MTKKNTHRELIRGWYPFTKGEIKRYVSNGYWQNLVVSDLLDRNCTTVPNKLAFADGNIEVTWQEMQLRAKRLAIHLSKLGIGYGDFFVFDLMNTVYAMDLLFSLSLLGAIPVMCLPRHRRLEISHHVKLHEAKGIVVPVGEKFDYVGMVNEFKAECPYLKVFLTVGGEAPSGWTSVEDLLNREIEREVPKDYLEQFKPVPDDIFVEHLSGGTTGVPKGIPRTHHDQICQWDYLGRTMGYTDDSIALVTLPVLHNAAMVALYGPAIYRGGTTVLCKSPRPEAMFELIQRYKVTHTILIPIQMTYWMEAKEKIKNYDFSSFKVMSVGAEKCRPEIVRWFIEELGLEFVNIFGMAEGPLITTRWDNRKELHMHTIGRPVIIGPDAEFRLVDDDNREVKQGEVGEMVSKGCLTFKGYFRAEEENKKTFDKKDFFHSGDLMSLREDGMLVVEGRKKDMIKRAGENVYPPVIEDRIAQFKKVAYCAVVGMPDKVLGEKLCAFVQPVKGETVAFEEILNYLKGIGVAVYELPERFELVGGWPLTPINKINKMLLRAHITAKAVEEGAISKELGNEYLKRDKLSVDEITQGKVIIDFTGTPS